MVHILQVIIFLPYLIGYPANADLILDSIEEAVTLKKITLDFQIAVLPAEWSEYLKEDEEVRGVSKNLIKGLGIFAVVMLLLIFLLILYINLRFCRSRNLNCCNELYKKLSKSLFYDSFIRYMIESNLDITYENIFFVHLFMSFETNWQA